MLGQTFLLDLVEWPLPVERGESPSTTMFDCKVDSSKTWLSISSKASRRIDVWLHPGTFRHFTEKRVTLATPRTLDSAVKSFAKIDGIVKRVERVRVESNSDLRWIVTEMD
jgi:hypothetical protein